MTQLFASMPALVQTAFLLSLSNVYLWASLCILGAVYFIFRSQ